MLDYDILTDRNGNFYAEIFDPVSAFVYAITDTYADRHDAELAAECAIRHNGFTVAPAE